MVGTSPLRALDGLDYARLMVVSRIQPNTRRRHISSAAPVRGPSRLVRRRARGRAGGTPKWWRTEYRNRHRRAGVILRYAARQPGPVAVARDEGSFNPGRPMLLARSPLDGNTHALPRPPRSGVRHDTA